MKSDSSIYSELVAAVKEDIPEFEVVDKQTSKFMKRLNKIVKIFNKDFMTWYVTTVYPRIYVPEALPMYMRWTVLSHEWIHLRSSKRSSAAFFLKYFFPLWLAPLAFLAFLAIPLTNWWLLNLLWLAMLAPLPSVSRMNEELDGYTMTMGVHLWREGDILPTTREWIEQQFVSSAYYFMWPFKENMRKRVRQRAQDLTDGKYDNVYPYSKVREILTTN